MTDNLFPDDMFLSDHPDQDWKNLDEQTVAARMKRVDMSYHLYLQEITHGKRDWVERVVNRLAIQEGEAKRAKQVIADGVKVFRLFRIPEAHGGLGLTREELGTHSYRRLRVFAQNRDWSTENRERIPEMLADISLGEEKIREIINTEKGKTLRTSLEYTKLRFAFTAQDGAMIEEIIKAAHRRLAAAGSPVPEVGDDGKKLSAEYRDGVALQSVLADWMMSDSGLEDAAGNPIPNMAYMTGGAHASEDTNDQMEAEQTAVDAA